MMRTINPTDGGFDRVRRSACGSGSPRKTLSSHDARGIVPASKLGLHGLVEQPPGDRVWDLLLQAVPDLEAHLVVSYESEEDDAVVDPFATDLPGFGAPHGEVLQRLTLERREENGEHLVSGTLLDRLQVVVDSRSLPGRDCARKVREVRTRRRGHLERT